MKQLRSSVLAVLLLALATPALPRPEGATLKLGCCLTLSGPDAGIGLAVREGIQLGVEEANKAGGVSLGAIGTYRINVVMRNDGGNAESARNQVTDLVSNQGVHVVLGEVFSAMSLAGGPICQQAQIPMVTPASTDPQVTKVGNYVFRVCYMDSFQGDVMAHFAREKLKAKTAAIFTDDSGYSRGLGKYFAATFKKLGGEVVAEESYTQTQFDFKPQLLEIRQKSPDVFFVPGLASQAAQIAQQARDTGITSTLLGGDGFDSPKLREMGREAVEGAYFCVHFHPASPGAEAALFTNKFEARYHKAPTGMAALGYDAVRLVLDAVHRAGSLKGPAIREALAATRNFAGVTGDITINADRNAEKPAAIVEVTSTGLKLVQQLKP
jgi:branched-chain amino acid transport system substrate-binding protein